jgi:hypothetical protein
MLYFGSWSSEVFSAITGLFGTITGVFISQKTEGERVGEKPIAKFSAIHVSPIRGNTGEVFS